MDAENRSQPENTRENQVSRNERGQFLPGVSGNPKGKPPGALSWSTIIMNEALVQYGITKDGKGVNKMEAIAKKLIELALAGDMRAISEFGDRAEGKPRQSITVSDKRNPSEYAFSEDVEAMARQYDDDSTPKREVPTVAKTGTVNRRPGGKVRIRLANVSKQKKP